MSGSIHTSLERVRNRAGGLAAAVLPRSVDWIHGLLRRVDGYDGELVERLAVLADALMAGRSSPEDFVERLQESILAVEPGAEFRRWVERVPRLLGRRILHRRDDGTARIAIQIFYLPPHSSHPPHAHHDSVSAQCVLAGRIQLRQYDRLAIVDPNTFLIRPTSDRILVPYECFTTTEKRNNVHWFGALEERAVILDVNVQGHEGTTDASLRGRLYVDPTGPVDEDGRIASRKLGAREASVRFAGAMR